MKQLPASNTISAALGVSAHASKRRRETSKEASR